MYYKSALLVLMLFLIATKSGAYYGQYINAYVGSMRQQIQRDYVSSMEKRINKPMTELSGRAHEDR